MRGAYIDAVRAFVPTVVCGGLARSDPNDKITRMTEKTLIISSMCTAALLGIAPNVGEAQARSTSDTTTAYGARLTAPDATATVNQNRLNNRINNRLSLRIERYRLDSVTNPTAAFQSNQDDGTRNPVIVTPKLAEDTGSADPKARP